MQTVTVVYEIVDEVEWSKTNPMKYEHNGLKAIAARMGDVMAELDELAEQENV
jgi:hypothetical protein